MVSSDTGIFFILFAIVALLLGALLRSVLKKSILPYSVALLLLGLAAGLVLRSFNFKLEGLSEALITVTSIDPHLILFMFLPTLIFESAFAMETHLFRRIFSQIALLAVPGLMLAMLATAGLVHAVLPLDWSWALCLLFGALISATDPVAVVALLKEVSSRKRLETLIEGESLLNDGTAIVLFSLFLGLLSHTESLTFFEGVNEFFRVVLAGLLLGLTIGYLALLWMDRLFNNPMVEISISIASAYLVYFIAENVLHVSGVVAVVTMAILFAGPGRTRISVQSADFLHSFWQMMAYIANTLIFLLVGLIVALKVRLDLLEWWWILAALYLGVMLIRALSIAILMPILGRISIGLSWQKACVLTWGGLRGAVSLALALTLVNHPQIEPLVGQQILFMTAGIVVLTIVINGSSMGWLLNKLQLSGLPHSKQVTVNKAQHLIYRELNQEIKVLKQDPLTIRADWTKIAKGLQLSENDLDDSLGGDAESGELSIAYQRRLLETERQFYWKLYRSGGLERLAVSKLVDGVDRALDGAPSIGPREVLFHYWKTPLLVKLLGRISWLSRLSLSLSFNQMALGYEVARGYILAQDHILQIATELAPTPQIADVFTQQIAHNKTKVLEMIWQLQESFPEVAYSLETQTASRQLHNKERFLITQLVEEAQLEQAEAQKMLDDVERRLMALRNMPRFTTPSDFCSILKQVTWLAQAKERSLLSLSRHAWRRIYPQGELLQRRGEQADAIAILCRGKIQQHQQKIDTLGSCLGLEALLTGHFQQDIYSEGPCDLIWIDLNVLRSVSSEDPKLAERLSVELQQQLSQQQAVTSPEPINPNQ
ncbi:cation:proton antiporter domain-containing protein [Agarivorans sp. QJM3NY_25]|uniref:cation:proton antiporter domain-containing protein n=1 Tax=Agarivorans sp. QJM3NY_25 TaxID=3421430 RepID=UPI003D7DE668